jgi:hypothetical protein
MGHLEGAIAGTGDADGRARLLLEFGRAQHHAGRLEDACVTFRRGLEELRRGGLADSELTVELEGGYLNAAMFGSSHVVDAHRRAVDILANTNRASTGGEMALLSKAVMLRLWAGAPRDEIVGPTRRLVGLGGLGDEDAADSQAAWQAIATLGWCDDYAAADDAIRAEFATARRRGSVLAFALACVFRSRHALWAGPIGDAVHDARSAIDALPPASVYVSSAMYCLVSGLVEQGDGVGAEAALGMATQKADLPPFFAAWWDMARGRLAALQREDEQALEAFLAVGKHHQVLRIANPAVLPWRSEAGLAARRLGDHDRATSLLSPWTRSLAATTAT